MLQEFAQCYQLKTSSPFNVKHRQIRYVPHILVLYYTLLSLTHRCLAHIINLATQALISTHSKSKYYNGDLSDDQLPEDLGATNRDEIGIVRAICVKVRQFLFNSLLSNVSGVGALLGST
jgi:hypothetical protein